MASSDKGNLVAPSTLAVPFALDAKLKVHYATDRRRRTDFVCPDPQCRQPVDLHLGRLSPEERLQRKRPAFTDHFQHRAESSCRPETFEHHRAKFMVRDVVRAWLDGAQSPILVRGCARSASAKCEPERRSELPAGVTEVKVETALAGTARQPDLLLFRGDVAVAAIEIFHTHAVDNVKAQDLAVIPWIELDAGGVLRSPLEWRPTQDHFRGNVCTACRVEIARDERERHATDVRLQKLRDELGAAPPPSVDRTSASRKAQRERVAAKNAPALAKLEAIREEKRRKKADDAEYWRDKRSGRRRR